jgi:hypothetical protein
MLLSFSFFPKMVTEKRSLLKIYQILGSLPLYNEAMLLGTLTKFSFLFIFGCFSLSFFPGAMVVKLGDLGMVDGSSAT